MSSKYNTFYSILMIGLAVALGLLLSGDFGSAALVSFVAFCLMLMMDKIIGSGAQKSVQKLRLEVASKNFKLDASMT